MSELKLVLEKDGPLGWIIFNQPEKRNAVSQEMWRGASSPWCLLYDKSNW